MKTYENELDEMIGAVIELTWNHTIFCTLFVEKDVELETRKCKARNAHPEFFLVIHNSLLCSFCVTTDLLFHKDKNGKATSLCNLIRDIEASKPDVAKQLNEKIYAKKNLIEKVGTLRNEVCAHLWEAKTQQEVFAEADVRLNMMKEIIDLAQIIICELAEEAGGNRRKNIEEQQLCKETLRCVARDANQVMRTFLDNC